MGIRKGSMETVELMTVHKKLTGEYHGRTVPVTGQHRLQRRLACPMAGIVRCEGNRV